MLQRNRNRDMKPNIQGLDMMIDKIVSDPVVLFNCRTADNNYFNYTGSYFSIYLRN